MDVRLVEWGLKGDTTHHNAGGVQLSTNNLLYPPLTEGLPRTFKYGLANHQSIYFREKLEDSNLFNSQGGFSPKCALCGKITFCM